MEEVLVGPGTILAGRYTIERELGRGGMATVYLARDLKHHREVAVKVLRQQVASHIGSERFLREIAIAARLTHPHILPLHDSGESGELLYYVMPFVEGESLHQRLARDGQLPVAEALRIAREVADALAYAHAHGVVHRDIKPGNILLESGHAVVADFGIARALSFAGGEELTTSGLAIGTPIYMSPEQVGGSQVDGRSDVYSLACVLYEMLAGVPPFRGPDARVVAARHLYEPPPILASIRPEVPYDVAAAIERALAKAPANRFRDADAFAEALATSGTRVRPRPEVAGARRAWSLMAVAGLVPALFMLWRHSGGGAGTRQPDWILVADFDGPPGDRGLTDAVRELVTAELDQSRHVATMPRQQLTAVMRDAGLSDSVPVTADLARELAVRSSVRAILTGSVRPLKSGQYSVVLRAINAEDGSALLTASGAASDADLVPQIQELGRVVRRGLGEHREEIEANKPLTQVATPSFEAYRKYIDGVTLGHRGEVEGSIQLFREALALDPEFAAAWAAMSVSYAQALNPDSSRRALVEALARPERLNTAQRYRLEAEAAYLLHYDLPTAVQWYGLHLEHAPQSISGHNNLGVYLSELGRYDEALEQFRTAARIAPFGPAQSQIPLFNATAMLIALGRTDEAHKTSRELTGTLAVYSELLQLTAAGQWSAAESLALRSLDMSGALLKSPALTMWAGSLAARGAVAQAHRVLRDAADGSKGGEARWYQQAALLLSVASGQPAPRHGGPRMADSTPGSLTIEALMAAVVGDTTVALRLLDAIQRLTPVERLRLGDGPLVARGWIAARGGRWTEVTRMISAAAVRGENDGSNPDQVASLATRWLVAGAYERLGEFDSAAAYYELAAAPTRVPFRHLALRGLVYPFAQRRMALLYVRLRRPRDAELRWKAFSDAFTTPDAGLATLTAWPGQPRNQ